MWGDRITDSCVWSGWVFYCKVRVNRKLHTYCFKPHSKYFARKMGNRCRNLLMHANRDGNAVYKAITDFIQFWRAWKSVFGPTLFFNTVWTLLVNLSYSFFVHPLCLLLAFFVDSKFVIGHFLGLLLFEYFQCVLIYLVVKGIFSLLYSPGSYVLNVDLITWESGKWKHSLHFEVDHISHWISHTCGYLKFLLAVLLLVKVIIVNEN